MLGERPVYRFARGSEWSAVFADNGRPLDGLTAEQAMTLTRQFAPEFAASARYDRHLADADQWALGVRSLSPTHRVALGDSNDTELYVSDRTGEVVMRTTRSGRLWGYLGAVLHWLYFTPFRRHSALWINSVIGLSIARVPAFAVGACVGNLAVFAEDPIPRETRPRPLAVRGLDALAPLRRAGLRTHNLHVDSQRLSFARSLEMAPGHHARLESRRKQCRAAHCASSCWRPSEFASRPMLSRLPSRRKNLK